MVNQRLRWLKALHVLRECYCEERPPHDSFETIASADCDKFQSISDAEFHAAVRHIAAQPTKASREQWERAYGLTWDPHSLLANDDSLRCLPPSSACNDVLHAYFSNGVASVELWQLVNTLRTSGLDLANLRGLALEKPWLRYGMNPSPSRTFIKYILSDKMFAASHLLTFLCPMCTSGKKS